MEGPAHAPGALAIVERLACVKAPNPGAMRSQASREGGAKALSALRRRGVVLPLAHGKRSPGSAEGSPPSYGSPPMPMRWRSAEAARLEGRAPRQAAPILRELAGGQAAAHHRPTTGVAGWMRPMAQRAKAALRKKGLASYREVVMRRDPFTLRGITRTHAPALTDEQAASCRADWRCAGRRCLFPISSLRCHRLRQDRGVFGRAIARARARRARGALLLVPEIRACGAECSIMLKARFGDEVAVLHSALSAGERFDEWQRIRRGRGGRGGWRALRRLRARQRPGPYRGGRGARGRL